MDTKYTPIIMVFFALLLVLAACNMQGTLIPNPSQIQEVAAVQSEKETTASTSATTLTQPGSVTLDPGKGQDIGFVYEAFLSPHQEPGEEKDTPVLTPKEFLSTAPSLLRNERTSHGHGRLRFTNDLSKAYVDVKVENVNPEDIVMFHIHCGRPDVLGPILVDFAFSGDIQENFADDAMFSVVLTNENIEKTSASGHGLVAAFTAGCSIIPGLPDDVKTIAGMQYIAQQGELYFNLHTKAQTFYGDIRGRLHPVMDSINEPTP